MRMLRTKEAVELELKKRWGKRGKGGIREERERLKLSELNPRSPHSFGILLKSGLLFSPP